MWIFCMLQIWIRLTYLSYLNRAAVCTGHIILLDRFANFLHFFKFHTVRHFSRSIGSLKWVLCLLTCGPTSANKSSNWNSSCSCLLMRSGQTQTLLLFFVWFFFYLIIAWCELNLGLFLHLLVVQMVLHKGTAWPVWLQLISFQHNTYKVAVSSHSVNNLY